MTCPACGARNEGSATACASCGAALSEPTVASAGEPVPVAPGPDLRPGALFHGRYEILGTLGRGGMGMVYRAHDRTLDEHVAIKVLRPELADDATMAERFKSEIKLARKVRHRNVCAIHDFGEDRGVLYISMELIDGEDLRRVLRERGALPRDEAFDVAIQVAEGLEAVHAAGIIHRDLKSSNVVVDGAGVARLMDFGIAKRQEGSGTLTGTGLVLGTPEYMSPEQAQGKRVDARTDIYALGVVIYEIFAGDVPFRGETPIATILKQLHDAPPLEHPSLPDRLRPVLRRALSKDPAARPATAAGVAAALRDARTPAPSAPTVVTAKPPARPPAAARPAPPPAGRGRALWLGAAAVAVGAGLVVYLSRDGGPAPEPTVTIAHASPAPAPTAPPTASVETMPSAPSTAAPTAVATRASTPHARSALSLRPEPTAPPSAAPVVTAPSEAPPPTPPAGPGALKVVVQPWAEVEVDGRALGTTPLDSLPLPAGRHTVVVRHPSYQPYSKVVTIRAGEETPLSVILSRDGTPRPD